MKSWYKITAAAKASAELDIMAEIGGFGIRAADFIRDLRALGDVQRLTLNINSPGGEVFDGLAIYNALKRHPARITVRIDGIAASIASAVAMAGDKVLMPDNAMLMIHDPAGIVVGTAEDMRELAGVLDKTRASLVSIYKGKTGLPEEELEAMMAAETWLTAAEAKAKGFCDRVLEPMRLAADARTLTARYRHVPAALTRPQEVADLCALAGMPHRTAELVASGRSVKEVRALLIEAKATASEAEPIIAHHNGATRPQPQLPDPAEIYARRARAMGQVP